MLVIAVAFDSVIIYLRHLNVTRSMRTQTQC